MQAGLYTIVLCVTLDSHSATAWINTWSFILWRIQISVLCVVNDSYPGKKEWHMKGHAGDNLYLCALCNQKLICRNYPRRHNKVHSMDNTYPYALCFREFISINHTKRHLNMNSGKFQELLTEIFSFGNVNGRQKTFWEYPATQSMQKRCVCYWWKVVINYLCSTYFVWYSDEYFVC